MNRILILVTSIILMIASPLLAATHIVRLDGSGNFTTISEALDAAHNGDLIRIGPGIYYESLVVSSQVTIEAEGNWENTILDGGNSHRIMLIQGPVSVFLRGLAFQNAHQDDGSALLIWQGAAVQVEDCLFADNTSTGSNAVHIRHESTSASFLRCQFLRNQCPLHGAAIGNLYGSRLNVKNCWFMENTAEGVSGAVNVLSGHVVFQGNYFLNNSGAGAGALAIQDIATGEVTGNSFFHNTGGATYGAVYISATLSFTQNMVTNTIGGPGLATNTALFRSCNLYFDNEGGSVYDQPLHDDELETDPLFCELAGTPSALCANSPALDFNNECGTMGAWPEGCGACGNVATEGHNWGHLKSLYR